MPCGDPGSDRIGSNVQSVSSGTVLAIASWLIRVAHQLHVNVYQCKPRIRDVHFHSVLVELVVFSTLFQRASMFINVGYVDLHRQDGVSFGCSGCATDSHSRHQSHKQSITPLRVLEVNILRNWSCCSWHGSARMHGVGCSRKMHHPCILVKSANPH